MYIHEKWKLAFAQRANPKMSVLYNIPTNRIMHIPSHALRTQPDTEDSAKEPPAIHEIPTGPRLKILVSAYACSPSKGSEYGVGWGWVQAISRYHDLWVLTASDCKDEIESELLRRPELRSRIKFHYIPRLRYKRVEHVWPPAYLYTYRKQWQRAAYELGRYLHRGIGFDIVHQLTYVGFRVPGLLWKLDVPFVWGPIGGLEQTTWALLPALGVRGCLYFLARNLLNDWDRRFSRTPKLAFARAEGGIIAATTGIQKEIKRFYGQDSTVACEIGLPPVTRNTPVQRTSAEPLAILWCGNLVPGKALPFLLSALQMLPPELNWNLTIIGSGPCSAKWRTMAGAIGVDDRCYWLGQVPRESVLRQMQAAHVLAITSVYDLTSTVLVEALANGLPVVCPNHCGFTDAIHPDCGIRVPACSRLEIIAGIRDALIRMNDESFRFSLACGALRRSLEYQWDIKARIVSSIYSTKVSPCGTVLSQSPDTQSEPILWEQR
jgi:glycosyltransferase involved in cell wall biosynthesis